MQVSSASPVEKIRLDGKVVGFRERDTGRVREMYDGGATRRRRLAILTRKLAIFISEETCVGGSGDHANEREAREMLKQAIGLANKAGEKLEAQDRRLLKEARR